MKVRTWLAFWAVSLLVGCGGGGGGSAGGGAGTGSSGKNYPLTLSTTPASLTATLVQGAAELFTLNARVTGSVSTTNTFYVVIDDTSGIIQATKVRISEISSTSGPTPASNWLTQLVTGTTLPPGEHKGDLDVRVCSDLACATVYGQTSLPYDFDVAANFNMTSVATLSGAADWQTGGGNASRMSYVPVTLDPSRFSVRWLQTDMGQLAPAGEAVTGPLVTDSADQLVIMMVPPTQDTSSPAILSYGGFIAYSENDGTPVWHATLFDSSGAQQEPGRPAISDGIVYATQGPDIDNGGDSGDVSLTGLNAKTGAVIFSSEISDTFNQRYDIGNDGCGPGSPAVTGGMAFVNPGCISEGAYGSNGALPIAAFDAQTGQSQWTGNAQGGERSTTLAADANDLYYLVPLAATQPTLTAVSQTNGAMQWQTTLSEGIGYTYTTTPMLDGSGGAIVTANTPGGPLISRYDLTSGQLTWQTTIPATQLGGMQAMAVANGTVYVGYDAAIMALNATDGSTTWSWSAASNDDETSVNGQIVGTAVNSMIATNNLLFVGTDRGVYAVDLSTHQTAWTLAVPGYAMAISPSGMLYVATSEDWNVSTSGSYNTIDGALLSVNLH